MLIYSVICSAEVSSWVWTSFTFVYFSFCCPLVADYVQPRADLDLAYAISCAVTWPMAGFWLSTGTFKYIQVELSLSDIMSMIRCSASRLKQGPKPKFMHVKTLQHC